MKDLLAIFDGVPKVTVGCPGCNSRVGEVVVIRHEFSFVRCASCSSLYVNPRPTEDSLLEMYRRFPDFAAGHGGDASHVPSDEMREAWYRLKCVLEVARPGRLLDVGFGSGAFLSAARGSFDVAGIDLAVRTGPITRFVRAIKGHVRSIPFADGTFAAVTAFEILEHLFEIRPFLREVYRILAREGVFVVQTGDAGCLPARFNLQAWRYLLPPVHLNVFSRRAILNQMREAGFEKAKAWSFGRAPGRTPFLSRFPSPEALRPLLDLAARAGLIGQMLAFRKANAQ